MCGSTTRSPVELGAPVRIYRCAECGLVHAGQQEDPDDVFRADYLTDSAGFGLDLTGPAMQAYLAAASRRRLSILHRRATPPGRLLDVGCGTGEFLAAAADGGWTATGVEPVDASAAIARSHGLAVTTGLSTDLPPDALGNDVVSACHVLEHMLDPVAFLRELARCGQPGGTVLVESPNYRSMARRSAGAGWRHLRAFEHVLHLEPATMRTVFDRAGLLDVRLCTPTYVGRTQTPAQARADLADPPVVGHAPGAVQWPLLRAVEAAYRAAKVGDVIVATARIP